MFHFPAENSNPTDRRKAGYQNIPAEILGHSNATGSDPADQLVGREQEIRQS
jgi:hypothetical protein